MQHTPQVGQFVWCELMTTDRERAAAFYAEAIGWSVADSGMPGVAYTIASAGPVPVGGIMILPDEAEAAGRRPGWLGYIGVADVDGMAGRVAEAGGTVHRPPTDIPGVGRFAVVADPQRAVFILFTPAGEAAPPPPAGETPGRVGWHELLTTDATAAFGFYAGLFGWTLGEAIDVGPMGTYQLFAAGGPPVGGMMTMTTEHGPTWNYYFTVDGIQAAVGRVAGAGGRVVNGPMQVPGGQWVAQAVDPQGASFAMVSRS